MSDKSIGDHTNRNVVKNPLLSTAVTGLSLEDLTHNAVLLPVAQSQELITRQDQQSGFQSIALAHPEQRFVHPPGDPTPNITHPIPPPTTANIHDRQNVERATSTLSKASAKSEDDFDVEEYFARLQGTRYVSAPINSSLKEDPQVNLQATEENLEEINLNEPEKSPVESQGITADIAQNFSQLPTVLPQVASAVFSSFSNMLNYKSNSQEKSREQTPEKPVVGYKEVPLQKAEDVGVCLMGMDEPAQPKVVAPPPKEPPVGGTTNFRITTKKKAYAQIPGLSSQAPGPGMPDFGSGHPPGQPGANPMAGHHPPLPGNYIPMSGATPPNPEAHLPQIPPTQAQSTRSEVYRVPPTHAPKPGCYPGQMPGPYAHIQGPSPTNISYSQVPGLGYAQLPAQNVISGQMFYSQASTKPTMFHDYMNPQKRAVYNPYEIQENPPIQTQATIKNPPSTRYPLGEAGRHLRHDHHQHYPVCRKHHAFIMLNPLVPHENVHPAQVIPQDINVESSAHDHQSATDTTQEDSSISQPVVGDSQSPATTDTSQDKIDPPQMQAVDNVKIFNPLESHEENAAPTIPQTPDIEQTQPALDQAKQIDARKDLNIFNPLESANVQTNDPASFVGSEANLFTTVDQKAQQVITQAFSQEPSSLPAASIIPPPPMFSNLPKKDGLPSVQKTVLPPSVARRIGANHPIIKPQIMQPSSISPKNIFIPTLMSDDNKGRSPVAPDLPENTVSIPSAFVQFHVSSPSVVNSKSGFRDGGVSGLTMPYKQDFTQSWIPPAKHPNHPENDHAGFFIPSPKNILPLPPRYGEKPKIMDRYYGRIVTPETVVPEPPKVTRNLNYRMANKRPQYYSGPIEGVGSISNNVKPIIPVAEPNSFQGQLFTPNQPQPEQVSNVEPAPFDISQPTNVTPQAQFDVTQPQTSAQPEYSTAFDLSRPTSETYEPEPEQSQESKGFGIIGSLKSKLSALDINKIQNTVTNFFDPAYNDTKKEPAANQGIAPYEYKNQGNTPIFGQQDSSLEIFVPNNELSQTYTQGYNSQLNYPSHNYSQSNQYYHNQAYYTPDQAYNQVHGYASPVYGNYVPQNTATFFNNNTQAISAPNSYIEQVTQTQTELNDPLLPDPTEEIVKEVVKTIIEDKDTEKSEPLKIETTPDSGSVFTESTCNTYNLFLNNNEAISTPVSIFAQINVDVNKNNKAKTTDDGNLEPKPSLNFFDNQQFNLPVEEKGKIVNQFKDLQISDQKQKEKVNTQSEICSIFSNNNIQPDIKSGIDFFENIPSISQQATSVIEKDKVEPKDSVTNMGNNLLQIQESENSIPTIDVSTTVPTLDVSNVPLFGLSTMLAEKAKEMSDLQDNPKGVNLENKAVERSKLDSSSSADFFETISTVPQPLTDEENEGVSELSICETCREVTKPDDKDVDDLTKQLIENITSPIQLSNPVVAPLTESNTPVDVLTNFETKQCAEISHITEETIETIQVQSASELLDNAEEESKPKVINYGWTAPENDSYVPPEVLLEHDYSFQMDPHALGFYGSNAMFFENIPNNASDELKAEFKSSQEDTPGVLPIEMNEPTAPPAEDDDSKSDETGGLDVHSIEQDAKKDFPIFEEFVIEPSETDDDKIEYREREKSSDETTPEEDSFTNRVEKFKKMEETTVEKQEELTEEQKNMLFDIATASQNIPSPAIAIASYFDTGNFAVESHYRNSLSSPSALHFQMGSPEIPMRIPPGFENEFKRRLSGLIAQDNTMHDSNKDLDKNIMHIPETSTQTKPITTTTYSAVSNVGEAIVITSTIEPIITEDTPKKEETTLPAFASVFGRQDSGDALPTVLPQVEEKKEAAAPFFAPEVKKTEPQSLPDPISFFGSEQEPANTEADNSFNRLASYFTTPAKTDPEKSFFELSQSQNHYRHSTSNPLANKNNTAQNTTPNTNFDPNIIQNIPTNVYIANLNLMKDLTSPQNIVTTNDQVIKTVNYFTVEYDNDDLKALKLEPKKDENHLDKANISYPVEAEETDNLNDEKIVTVVSKCKYCCSIDSRRVVTLNKVELDNVEFKFRRTMDSEGSSPSKAGPNEMEQKKEDTRREVTVSFGNPREESEGIAMLSESRSSTEYSPVKHHWFYRVDVEGKSIWRGFSATDSKALEEAFLSPDLNENTLVPTDGGRYDVNVTGRLRIAVYWPDKPTNVRRCSWFYKGATLYVPYTEPIAEKLEEEYRHGVTTGEWHRRLVLPNNESVVMHGPAVMVHFPHTATDAFGSAPLFVFGKRVYRNPPKVKVSKDQSQMMDHLLLLVHGAGEYRIQKEKESTMRPRVVRRGCDDTEIEDPEPSSIDHLLLLCHGVGSACDMRFRPVEEVVDDFRATSLQLLQSHYRNSFDKGVVNRVEVLPISWHSTLHSGTTGIDKRLAAITLESIPRLRSFTNDTLLDVLLYTSPVFCQTIIDTVCAELNRIYALFKLRNPSFKGTVSLGGHSLGSVILYDLLCHQRGEAEISSSPHKSYVSGPAGTGQPSVNYPALEFTPAALYALGSPIAMFECIRGVKSLGADFCLPTCKNFFNIFHPYDPIAYRIEPLITAQLGEVKPYLIPHHKGRKRMHLELKDTMARVGADLKQKLLESIKATWTSMWKTQPPPNDGQLEKVVEEEIEKEQLCEELKEEGAQNNNIVATAEMLGRLNAGRRVDYVLQEAPFEMINEYLFAMSSHVGYWESEDTMLLILREIYDCLGVQPDCTVPQHTMTVERTRTQDDAIIMGVPEHPSTSRGGT